jgi:hypothetical protein
MLKVILSKVRSRKRGELSWTAMTASRPCFGINCEKKHGPVDSLAGVVGRREEERTEFRETAGF